MLLPTGAPLWLELLLRVVIVLLVVTVAVLGLTYLERKVIGRIQRRVGPMRTGPLGLLQPIADALKLMSKEDVLPGATDKPIFWVAPLVVFVSGFLMWVSIPFTRNLVVRNLDMGLFYVIAVSVVSIVGMVMAGWGSSNKYSLLGGLRAAAQLISYELPLIVAALAVVMVAQSTDLTVIVDAQGRVPNIVLQPVALVLFLLAGLAELGRAPFDIPHAES
jgi:NADH-quinone oxidoreductase subunit H